MRRRALLTAAMGTAVLGGCRDEGGTSRHLLVVTTKDGMSMVDEHGRVVRGPRVVAAATPDWRWVVTAAPDASATRVTIEDLQDLQGVPTAVALRDQLEPRIVSNDGTLVASVTPGGAGVHGLHRPGGRERTTIVVSDAAAGERTRLDLPGNLEPEAFSPDGTRLFILDFLPPDKPVRYRASVVDLATRELTPIEEETTHAHRIVRVHDQRRGRLFAICSHEGDSAAFVHRLDLVNAQTHRLDLPTPFGRGRPGVHALALDGMGERLSAIHSLSARVADIDPDRLVLKGIGQFATAAQDGKPGIGFTRDGRMVVSVDGKVIATEPYREMATPGEPRGLVIRDDQVWAGHPEGVVRFDLSTGQEMGRTPIPGLYVLKRVRDR